MMRPLRGERGLVEAAQDQLELPRIGVDVADGENPGRARLEFLGVDGDQVLVPVQPQSAIGPSFIVSPKNGSRSSQASSTISPLSLRSVSAES